MFFNYLKISFRNLRRDRLFSIINISGLAMGIAAFMLIITYCLNALQYDNFHDGYKSIYRVVSKSTDEEVMESYISWGLARHVNENNNAWESIRMCEGTFWMSAGENSFRQQIFFSDANFFSMFSVPLSEGSKDKALELKNSIVLGEELARKFFGNDDPVGKTVRVNEKMDFIVSGVIGEIPSNSIFQIQALMPLVNINELFYPGADAGWNDRSATTFLKTKLSESEITSQLSALFKKNAPKDYQQEEPVFYVEPITHVFLNRSGFDFGTLVYSLFKFGSYNYVLVLMGIGFLILSLAVVNYFNLSTSVYTKRIKEIGVRKVTGASKSQLRLQFIGESMVTTFAALFFSLFLFWIGRPFFERLIAESLPLGIWGSNYFVIAGSIILLGIILGLINGSYPAFYLTTRKLSGAQQNFKAATVQQGSFRNMLVIFQVTISMSLLICLAVVIAQLQFMKSVSRGFNQQGIITIPIDMANTGTLAPLTTALSVRLLTHSGIENVSRHQASMGRYIKNRFGFFPEGSQQFGNETTYIDENYFDTYRIKTIAGKGFKDYPDSVRNQKIILNASAAREYGWSPEEAVHKQVRMYWSDGPSMEVIGIVNDFHFQSLQHVITPVVFQYAVKPHEIEYISVRISSTDLPGMITYIGSQWKEITNGFPFEYYFTEDDYATNYALEERQQQSITASALLAIVIACLGLFGLASFAALQRTKEIGIRKVLGASVTNILFLLSKRHMALLFIASLMAFPVSYYLMSRWIEQFAFRTSLQWWMFVLPSLAVCVLALFAVGSQSLKTSMSNPIDSLRSE
jgi:putative ABC transport system permease protein